MTIAEPLDPTDPGPWGDRAPNTEPAAPPRGGLTRAPRTPRPRQIAPHDLDAEASLLSAALLDADHVVPILDNLPADAFYGPAHHSIATAILQLDDDGITPDPVTVAARLKANGLDSHTHAVVDVAARSAAPTAAPGYASIVRDHHRRRATLALAAELEAAARDGHHSTVATLLEHALADHADPTDEPCASALIDWSTVWDRGTVDAEWLAEPLLAAGRGHAIYATAKAGKSLLALEVAAATATGQAVLDQPAGPPRQVVYFDLEMTEADLVERLDDLGYGPDDDLTRLAYYLLPNLPALDTPEGGRAVERIVTAHRADLVVFDTTSRVVAGPENDADTFRAFYRHTGARLKAAGITYVRLDHAGKDTDAGQRGSSAKADDVDVVWKMTATDSGVKLKATHARMSWVDREVSLLRLVDPLVHKRVPAAWPAGTADKAAQLDRLDVPIDASRPAARKLIVDAGETPGKNDLLGAALRWRRERPAGEPTGPTDEGEW